MRTLTCLLLHEALHMCACANEMQRVCRAACMCQVLLRMEMPYLHNQEVSHAILQVGRSSADI